jgi:hypothetical protein
VEVLQLLEVQPQWVLNQLPEEEALLLEDCLVRVQHVAALF